MMCKEEFYVFNVWDDFFLSYNGELFLSYGLVKKKQFFVWFSIIEYKVWRRGF